MICCKSKRKWWKRASQALKRVYEYFLLRALWVEGAHGRYEQRMDGDRKTTMHKNDAYET
jgi:hypothetical protein